MNMMTKVILTVAASVTLLVAGAVAQERAGAFSTLNLTNTTSSALRVGCAIGATPCTGGIQAGPISLSSGNGVTERARAFAMGMTQTRTFAAGNFTSDTGTFVVASGDVTTDSYRVIGDTLWWSVKLVSTTTTGPPNNLRIALPGSFIAQETAQVPCATGQTSVQALVVDSICTISSGASILVITKANASTFTAAADDWNVTVQIQMKVS